MINRILLLIMSLTILSGCAITEDRIGIGYVGRGNIEVVKGAENVTVQVTKADKRTVFKDRLSVKKNGYGMEMAKIVSTNDVSEVFRKAIEFELDNLGFKIGSDGKLVKVELLRFYNDFKMGFFAGDAIADGRINVLVFSKEGDILFSKTYEGGGIEKNIQLALGGNAKLALDKALVDIVTKVAGDKDFHQALVR